MSIETISNKYFLGTKISNVKILSSKIDEMITAINDFATSLTTALVTSDKVTVTKGNVTQITAITTGVTTNAGAGVITTVSSTLAAGINGSFKVTNNKVTSTSVIQLTADDKATAGWARVNVQDVANGEFYINVTNIHPTNAFNGIIKIHFVVL